jgi:hypothetical protein
MQLPVHSHRPAVLLLLTVIVVCSWPWWSHQVILLLISAIISRRPRGANQVISSSCRAAAGPCYGSSSGSGCGCCYCLRLVLCSPLLVCIALCCWWPRRAERRWLDDDASRLGRTKLGPHCLAVYLLSLYQLRLLYAWSDSREHRQSVRVML